jgi:hypothetical protein
MARFERTDSSEGLPAQLGTATQDLRVTVEQKLREIVEAAEAQAHEIEDRALEQAFQVEQDSERRARGRFHRSTEQADQMAAAIDGFEQEIRQALERLRTRGRALAAELGAEAPPEAAPAAEAAPAPTPAEVPEPAEAQESEEPQAQPDLRETVRRRILDMFLAGKPRAEAERMLTQLEDGGQYADLLDEVYESRAETQQGTPRRRGGRRRRRPGT